MIGRYSPHQGLPLVAAYQTFSEDTAGAVPKLVTMQPASPIPGLQIAPLYVLFVLYL